MKKYGLIVVMCAAAALISGCSSAQAACPGGRCASVGVWSPWGGFYYLQSPCAGGRCTAKPAAEPEEPDHFRDLTKMVEEPAPEVAEEAPQLVEFKPFCLRVAELVNAQRKALGLQALELDESLCAGCDRHSAWMANGGGFQHAYYAGARECIAYGVRSPESVVNMWLGSSGHRAIILGGGKTLGVGCSGSFWTLRVR